MVSLRSRTALFVPAEGRKLEKARRFLADELIFDLEDAVEQAELPEARQALAEALGRGGWRARWASVRVNRGDSGQLEADLAALEAVAETIHSLWLPKVESVAELQELRKLVPRQSGWPALTVLIESAAGMLEAPGLTRQEGVRGLALGTLDLSADLEVPELSTGGAQGLLNHVRGTVALAARAGGLEAFDGPWLALDDLVGFRADATEARLAAMTGKLCVHPKQLEVCADVFRVDQQQLERAQEILEQSVGVSRVRGQMTDAASHRLAARVVERAATEGVRSTHDLA